MKTFLIIDYWMQTILLCLMGMTIPLIFVPLLLLLGFGGWQLLSGLITAIFYKKLNREAYLPKALAYVLFLYLGFEAMELFPFLEELGGIAFILFVLITPLVIGFWYYLMVRRDYDHFCREKVIKPNTMEMNSPFVEERKRVIAVANNFPRGYTA